MAPSCKMPRYAIGDIVIITESNGAPFFDPGDICQIKGGDDHQFSADFSIDKVYGPRHDGCKIWWIGTGVPSPRAYYAFRHATNQEIQARMIGGDHG